MSAIAALSMDAYAAAPLLRFSHVGEAQGLSHRAVQAMVQDRSGFFWLATSNGLNRFDGHGMKVFLSDASRPGTLADNWVSALFISADGALWAGAGGKLQRYDPLNERFHTLPLRNAAGQVLEAQQINVMLDDGAGGLWLGTSRGLFHIDVRTGQATVWRQPGEGSAPDAVWALGRDDKMNLWVGANSGLHYLAAKGHRLHSVGFPATDESGLNASNVKSLLLADDGSVWFSTPAGLHIRDAKGATRRLSAREPGAGVDRIRALIRDSSGFIWAGGPDGLQRWDPAGRKIASYRHHSDDSASLASELVSSLYLDRAGVLWVGTELAGASKVDLATSGFEHFRHRLSDKQGLSNSQVSGITGNGKGTVWLSTLYGGLNVLDTASGTISLALGQPNGGGDAPPANTRSVYWTPDGSLWVGTFTGLLEVPPGQTSGRLLRLAPELPDAGFTRTTLRDRAKTLWVGTEGGLLRYHTASGKVDRYIHDAGNDRSLSDNLIFAVHEDPAGRIWVANAAGLDLYRPATDDFRRLRLPGPAGGAVLGRVYSLAHDHEGNFWVGTATGLLRIEVDGEAIKQVRSYGTAEGLASPWISSILPSPTTGGIWFSTRNGISHLVPSTGKVENYSAREHVLEGGYLIGSAYADQDGALYFGGPSGVTRVWPARIRKNMAPPQVAITDLQLFNRPLDPRALPKGVSLNGPAPYASRISLAHGLNVFSVEFAALHFADPSRNRYSYTLEGFDRDWTEVDAGKRRVTYTNLDPGKYTFKVKAANKDGLWNPQPAQLTVEILPPFWQTWWFRAAVLAAGVFGLWAGHRYRIRRLLAQKDVLERQVEERTAEVRRQQGAVERAMQELKATQQQLILSEKMAGVGTLTAGVAHEINNPANFAHVGVQLIDTKLHQFRAFLVELAGEGADAEVIKALDAHFTELQEQTATVYEGTSRIRDLVKDLRTFSRLDEAERKTASVAEGLTSTVRLLHLQYAAVATIHLEIAADAEIDCWPAQLNQTFMNIIVNGCQAVADQWPHADPPSGRVAICQSLNNEEIVITFQDNGCGMTAEQVEHIFEPFYTTRIIGEGVGLGLSIAYTIVKNHGGTITVESAVGKGSTFTIRLPRHRRANA